MGGDKAIIFDLGKVLVDFDYSITVRKIISQCAKGPESVLKLIDQSPILHQYESGEMDTLGFYETVVRETGYQGSREGFESAFSGIFTPIHPMIEFFRELIGEGVPVYVLSNTNELAIRYVEVIFPEINRATGRVYSWEEKCMKPDPKIYEITEGRIEKKGSDLFFTDDRQENIDAAKALGWNTVLHQEPDQTIDAIRRFLGGN